MLLLSVTCSVGGCNSGCNCGNSSTNKCNKSSSYGIYITYSCSNSVFLVPVLIFTCYVYWDVFLWTRRLFF